jgi:hypothetical protein
MGLPRGLPRVIQTQKHLLTARVTHLVIVTLTLKHWVIYLLMQTLTVIARH